MKPRIFLKHAWSDSGWDYQQWECLSSIGPDDVYGLGATPSAAYADWKRMVGA